MLLARLFLFSYRIWRRLLTLSQEVFVGFWLGVLSRRIVHAADELRYNRAANYHSREHNIRGLFAWEKQVIASHFDRCQHLIVIGAGGGREVFALSGMGYQVAGFECNQNLVQCAQDLLQETEDRGTVQFLPRDQAPSTDNNTDGIIVGWGTYMHIIGRAHRVNFLKNLHPLLEPDAPVLLSFFTRPETAGRYLKRLRIANAIRTILRREPVELGDDLVPNFVHRFTEEELQTELADAGFQLVRFQPEGTGPHDSGYAVATRGS